MLGCEKDGGTYSPPTISRCFRLGLSCLVLGVFPGKDYHHPHDIWSTETASEVKWLIQDFRAKKDKPGSERKQMDGWALAGRGRLLTVSQQLACNSKHWECSGCSYISTG